MMNSRITKMIANTVGLAAVAALGISVYQLGTMPLKEEKPVQEETKDNTEKTRVQPEYKAETPQETVDADTGRVEARITEQEEKTDTTEEELLTEEEKDNTGVLTGEDAKENPEQEIKNEENEAAETSAVIQTAPEISFSENTLMEWPVHGNILLDYSMDQSIYFPTLDQYKRSPAISVRAVEGAPVMSAADAKVFSVTQDACTGTTVTMELGNGYQAVYGQLKDVAVSEGDMIKKGTIIGYIAQPTKYYSTEGTNLYFAMKKDGEPIDPIAYLP